LWNANIVAEKSTCIHQNQLQEVDMHQSSLSAHEIAAMKIHDKAIGAKQIWKGNDEALTIVRAEMHGKLGNGQGNNNTTLPTDQLLVLL